MTILINRKTTLYFFTNVQLTFFVLFLRKAKGEFAYKLNGVYGELSQELLLR